VDLIVRTLVSLFNCVHYNIIFGFDLSNFFFNSGL
jgi:hypothetical protein